jgi:uncharacterized protein (TIGR02147 family)
MARMINIFDYTDYRKFLGDYYEERKSAKPSFSYQFLAKKAGFSNKGFVYNLVNGKRSLSKSNLFKLREALGLNKYETEYFENLVAFSQAKGLTEQDYYFGKLSSLKNRGRVKSEMQVVRKDQYEFYSTWYHSAVRSIIDMYEFKDDYKWLSRMIHPPINVRQSKHSIALLYRLGMIEKQKNGDYKVKEKYITTGKDVVRLAIQNFHRECASLSQNAIQNLPKDERNITGLTMGISRPVYDKICEEILQFQNRIAEIVSADGNADRVYQLNFHMFPMSRSDNERKKKL